MTIDLTKIGQNQAQNPKPDVEKLDDNNFIINGHAVKRSSDFSKQELEENAWTIDKFTKDGQITARPDDGKRDPNTEWIADDENSVKGGE